MFSFAFVFLVLLGFMFDVALLLNNGMALTPPMGWMSWGYYKCEVDCQKNPDKCLDEKLIMAVADAFYTEGYQEAGYEYVIIDDCWSERKRDKNDRLVPDRVRFPRGMKFLADYIHSRGLKFGMYTNIGHDTCMRYPGSRGHFAMDAKMFAEWQVDFLKVDGCFVEEEFLDQAYTKFGYYLNKTGRPMVYTCSWPYYKEFINNHFPNYSAVSQHCNMWRNFHDVYLSWDFVKFLIAHYGTRYSEIERFHGPGQWNDPDMLLFGTNTLTPGQSRVQIAVYAMLSAPLIISCDMKLLRPFEMQLLQNLDLIAIGQDLLGIMAKPHNLENGITLWVKRHQPMKGNKYYSFSFALVNIYEKELSASFTPVEYGLDSRDLYTVLDVFTSVFVKNITSFDELKVTVPAEDVLLYSLFPL